MIQKFRDLSILNMGSRTLSLACDSCSGVGMLGSDTVRASGYYTGYRTAFVALAETLAIGAEPLLIVNTLSVPMDGYGSQLIEGIKDAAIEAGMPAEGSVTGSTEENFIVPVTSLGITVLGELTKPLPAGISGKCDVYLIGKPVSGAKVLESRGIILDFVSIKLLMYSPGVVDILPVGSKGVLHELNEMKRTLASSFEQENSMKDLDASAGPATCALVAVMSSFSMPELNIPVEKLGVLKPLV